MTDDDEDVARRVAEPLLAAIAEFNKHEIYSANGSMPISIALGKAFAGQVEGYVLDPETGHQNYHGRALMTYRGAEYQVYIFDPEQTFSSRTQGDATVRFGLPITHPILDADTDPRKATISLFNMITEISPAAPVIVPRRDLGLIELIGAEVTLPLDGISARSLCYVIETLESIDQAEWPDAWSEMENAELDREIAPRAISRASKKQVRESLLRVAEAAALLPHGDDRKNYLEIFERCVALIRNAKPSA